ncbi:MAG TPA: hypothetical protein VGP52_13280 [Stellaceae bacterium]|jgi:divalent metal cation (Fe/Co/Zn/Cd) transporter|nr:hypothetical protein [Stellaceae bacterium]
MDRNAWTDIRTTRQRHRASRHPYGATRAPRVAALAIVTVSSLGLWAAIWYAAESLVSLWR